MSSKPLRSFPGALITVYFLLITLSCTPHTLETPLLASLYIYRFKPPAFVQFSEDFQPVGESPFAVPPGCELFNTFPSPLGKHMAVELNCPNGQTVLYLDTNTAAVTQPVTDTDSHFLAWANDGGAAYLKVDSLENTRVLRVQTNGKQDSIPIAGWTYDLSLRPDSRDFAFTFSRGLGFGSELHLAQNDARATELLYADP